MSELLDAEAWLDSQLAAANPPTDTPPPAQELAALPQPGVSPFLSNPPKDPAKPQGLYDLGEGQAPEQTNRILYPRFTDVTLPQTARGPVPDDPVEQHRKANAAAGFGDNRMDAEAWLDNAVATTPTPRSVKLPSGISSYANDFLKTLDTTKLTPEEYLSLQPDVEVVKGMLHNPQYTPTFEEWQDLTAIEKRLVEEGKIQNPSTFKMLGNAVGGFAVTAADFAYNTIIDAEGSITRPGETLDRYKQGTIKWPLGESIARSPATIASAGKQLAANYQHLAQIVAEDWNEPPKYVVNETGEFLANSSEIRLPDKETLTQFYANKGQTIRPVTEQELQKFDYDRFVAKRANEKAMDDAVNNTKAPNLFHLLKGEIKMEPPIQSQAAVGSMFADPQMWLGFSGGGSSLGISRFGKLASAKTLSGIEKASGFLVAKNDALLERFSKVVTDQTGLETGTIKSMARTAAEFVGKSSAGAGVAFFADKVGVPKEVSTGIALAFPLYKMGLGTLRRINTGSRFGKTILVESADATRGLDQVAREAIVANPTVPRPVREALERPSNFTPLESTPARIAANPAFSPQTRAVAQKLAKIGRAHV